jgi:hypothetical protein
MLEQDYLHYIVINLLGRKYSYILLVEKLTMQMQNLWF